MKPRVLLVEDDHLQRASAQEAIERAIGAKVETKDTEWDFHRAFESIAMDPPQIAVLDIMLRWANPAPDMPLAPEEVTNHPELAGLRCARRLLNDDRTRGVKIILYSVLGKDDLAELPPPGAICLTKDLDFAELIQTIQSLIADYRRSRFELKNKLGGS